MTSRSTTGPRFAVVRFVFAAFLVMAALQSRTAAAQAPAHVDVVALMVEFQPDTTRFTTGDGTFSGPLFEGVDAPRIDPLPHNGAYFQAHLDFLSNYVDRVSDGQTAVTTHLLSDVVRVSRPMGAYSPTGTEADSDAELSKLAALVHEAWTAAEDQGTQLPSGLNPEETAFIIFHAGVGRDIELVGTTLDKTPEDLPSLFFDADALDRLDAGGIALDGIPVANTMVLPRTESRLGVDALTSEPFLIELSINGLLAASFFNYLGVPDLFNTETGDSAIGPFGVMDALGIFAYSGLFPPEPSAWTKQFLGWQDAVSPAADGLVTLGATGLRTSNDAARISISDAEYFLVENRHRDPDGDGLRLRVWTHEGVEEVVFQNGDPEFNDQTVSGFPGGVVLEVDDYDFALPGGLDENDNPLLGGILIWHVDENRLAAGIDENAVNADRNARSIDLEEADGAQDIGFNSSSGFFGPRFDLGTPFDFWFEGNPVTVRTSTGQDIRLYENRFDAETTPSSHTNAGSPSIVVLEEFSSAAPIMTFRVGSATNTPVLFLGDWAQLGWGDSSPARGALYVEDNPAGFWSWRPGVEGDQFGGDPAWFWSGADGEHAFAQGGAIQPAVVGGELYDVTVDGVNRISAGSGQSVSLTRFQSPLTGFTSPAVEWAEFGGETHLFAGAIQGGQPVLLTVSIGGTGNPDVSLVPVPAEIQRIFVSDRQSSELFLLTGSGVYDQAGAPLLERDLGSIGSASLSGTHSEWSIVWTSTNASGGLQTVDQAGKESVIPVPRDCQVDDPLWYDVDADQSLDIVFSCGAQLVSTHQSGAMMAGFPLALSSDALSAPIVSRRSDGSVIMVVTTVDGSIDGWSFSSGTTERLAGFPLALGSPSATAPVLTGGAMAAISGAGTIRTWEFRTSGEAVSSDMGVAIAPPTQAPRADFEGLLDPDETYNWPNPIAEGETRIRFATAEPSDVRIDIVDLNGVLIERIDTTTPGSGVPTEVVWTTDAGSGVYLARVRASSTISSRSATHLIRMAIVR